MRPVHFALSVAMIATVPTLEAATYFTVTSTSMKDGARMPARFAADDPKRPCRPGSAEICPCPGQNVSPQLAWSNAPAGTKSFAVLMYDVDGQSGAGVSHWVAYNIAPVFTNWPRATDPRAGSSPAAAARAAMPTTSVPVPRAATASITI